MYLNSTFNTTSILQGRIAASEKSSEAHCFTQLRRDVYYIYLLVKTKMALKSVVYLELNGIVKCMHISVKINIVDGK